MAILSPEHLFDQALRLIEPLAAGPPRQVDLRRAVSSAYYGVFHALLTEAADAFVGTIYRSTAQYALVYRSVDHRAARDLCQEAKKQTMAARYIRYIPDGGFDRNIQTFADAFIQLQEKRHAADYDPLIRLKRSDAILAIDTARAALLRLDDAVEEHRKAFLTLLLFPPRSAT